MWRKVVFDVLKSGNRIVYPDDTKLFRNSKIAGDKIIADYKGDLLLAAYVENQKLKVYLHIDMTDGDGMAPLGIVNDGTDKITVTATFRAGESAESDVLPVDMAYRVNLRNDQGAIVDIIKIVFDSGVARFSYTTTGLPGVCHIDQGDLVELIGGKSIKLVGNTEFKVYRDMTS